MAKTALCDTGFWIGLFDNSDGHSEESETLFNLLIDAKYDILAPWPTLYEFLNSRFFRRNDWIRRFQHVDGQGHLRKVSDVPYRETAFNNMFIESRTHRDSSLVDFVIREMLLDTNIRVSALITYNNADFADLCQLRRIELLP